MGDSATDGRAGDAPNTTRVVWGSRALRLAIYLLPITHVEYALTRAVSSIEGHRSVIQSIERTECRQVQPAPQHRRDTASCRRVGKGVFLEEGRFLAEFKPVKARQLSSGSRESRQLGRGKPMHVVAERHAYLNSAVADGAADGLATALARLDERLRSAVAAAGVAYGPEAATDPHRGLYLGDDEVARLLARAPCVPLLGTSGDGPSLAEDTPSLAELGKTFGLERLDLDIIVVALAPELDLRYERLYAYLQDDVTRRRPSVDLALNLLCENAGAKLRARSRFAADAPLIRHRLVELAEPAYARPPLLARALKLDDQVVRALIGERGLDARLAGCARLVLNQSGLQGDVPMPLDLARTARADRRPLRLSFEGRRGSGRRAAAEALAADLQMPLLTTELAQAVRRADDAAADKLALLVREARLQDAVLFLDDFDVMISGEHADELGLLLRELEAFPGIAIIARSPGPSSTPNTASLLLTGLVTVTFSAPSAAKRRACWKALLADAGVAVDRATVEALADRFRLTPTEISRAVTVAVESSAHSDDEPDLFAAARALSGAGLSGLARKVTPRRHLDDIVLPPDRLDQLREVCDALRYRSRVYEDWGFDKRFSLGTGLNILFAGPSGTGKTLAAEILAGELGVELYKIDLAAVVSKYIGETEKNLARIFAEAEAASAILFFDEADALFGKRSAVKDSHDRYANIEIGYLLQQMDEFDGTVVLATNLRRNMDDAFVRRMHFTVEFPLPDEPDRLRIWDGIWPATTPLDPELDHAELAHRVELSGGHIRNIAVAAAFLAAADGRAVTMEHLQRATRREYQKLGQIVLETATSAPGGSRA
ncbi:ATP-binding protein [Kribbella sp. NBC_01484]|uniref:ATP-binding protein n=1 Tax=Kribbella sp. NBC_01484 TaxID=2903579 RepID=UPI002E31AE99|nr:ATP-binding protein [Kribbella sp. NBC_01484]